MAQWVECFCSVYEALVQSPALHKPSLAVWAWNPSNRSVEARGSGIQDNLWLHRNLEVNLGYMRSCLKTKTKQFYGPDSRPPILKRLTLNTASIQLKKFHNSNTSEPSLLIKQNNHPRGVTVWCVYTKHHYLHRSLMWCVRLAFFGRAACIYFNSAYYTCLSVIHNECLFKMLKLLP